MTNSTGCRSITRSKGAGAITPPAPAYAWICSIPGVPAGWPKASRIERELDAIRREAL